MNRDESHRQGRGLSFPPGTSSCGILELKLQAVQKRDDCPEFRQLSETSAFFQVLVASFSMTYKRQSNCTVTGARFQRAHMLRIQREANGQVVLRISGRLDGENFAELKKLIGSEGADRRIILDLRELTLVDHEAVGFLRECDSDGLTLRNCPPYICEWIARQRDGK